MDSDIINIYNLNEYSKPNIFNIISNKHIIIYFIIGLVVLYIAINTHKFSYVFISVCLLGIIIYYTQKISYAKFNNRITLKNRYISELNINPESLFNRDNYLVNLLYSARFIKAKSPNDFAKLVLLIEDFLVTFETLKQNKNNIFLKSTDMIKPFELNKIQHSILINDIRDQLERVLKHIQIMIHGLPNEYRYLNSYYNFNQLIRSHLSKYYNRIMSDYNYIDHTSQYHLIRSSENKYDFIDS